MLYSNITLPEMVIFGLEFTLFPFFLDLGPNLPFRKTDDGKIVDCSEKEFTYYEDVPKIFEFLKEKNIKIALTTCTPKTREANQLINLFGWDKYVDHKTIGYPVFKKDQVVEIHDLSDINYCNTVFFDDAHGNIHDVKCLRVHCVLVKLGGINMKVFMEGLKDYQEAQIKMYEKADNYPKIPAFMKEPYISFYNKTEIFYFNMMYFDNGYGNIRHVELLGVHYVTVEEGMTLKILEDGIKDFKLRKSKRAIG